MKNPHIFDPKNVELLESQDRKLWENPNRILRLVEIKPNFVATDLGCGSGYFTIPLAKKVEKVYAIDVQKEMLQTLEQKTRQQNIKNIEPMISKESKIPLEDETLELLISVNALHEFADTEKMINEIRRVLKPKGTALIVDFKKEETGFGPPIAIRISKKRAVALFERMGFKTLKSTDLPFHYALVFSK